MDRNKTENTQDTESIEMDCLTAFDQVYAFINNELTDPDMVREVEHHLSHCKSCFTRTEMEKKINQRIKETKQTPAPDRLQSRLKKLMDNI